MGLGPSRRFPSGQVDLINLHVYPPWRTVLGSRVRGAGPACGSIGMDLKAHLHRDWAHPCHISTATSAACQCSYDIVVASDVLYWQHLYAELVVSLVLLSVPETLVILAWEERRPQVSYNR